MITLLTGAPGTGKTAQLVEWLRTEYKDRPVYAHGLNGLKLPHEPIDASRWHLDLPDGAILVVDEVQQVWRPRGPGHKPSDAVMALETHRHRGVDVFLTTQKPSLLDANVRGLVGRHVHIRDTGWLGRRMYEWPECNDALAWKNCPLKRKYKLPKAAFPHYRSAVEHTVVAKGRSWRPAVLALMALALVALVVRIGFTLKERTTAAAPTPVSASAPRGVEPPQQRPRVIASELSPAAMLMAFTPRVSAMPETAPAYDHLRVVVNMPRVVGGYCTGGRCRCYDQQNRIADLDPEACRKWIAAPPFDAYATPAAAPGPAPSRPHPEPTAQAPRVVASEASRP